MRLNQQTDYALRTLLYLASTDQELVSVGQIARAYGISLAHLRKVVRKLSQLEMIETRRGRTGGIRLARSPDELVIGAVVVAFEPDFDLVECMGQQGRCVISPVCTLRGVFFRARQAMMRELMSVSVADCVGNPAELREVLSRAEQAQPAFEA